MFCSFYLKILLFILKSRYKKIFSFFRIIIGLDIYPEDIHIMRKSGQNE